MGILKRTEDRKTKKFDRLGREIKISPKSNISVNYPGYKLEYFVETVTVSIGIGNDHTAQLVMDREAWQSLNSGEPVHVMTTTEHEKMI